MREREGEREREVGGGRRGREEEKEGEREKKKIIKNRIFDVLDNSESCTRSEGLRID